MHGAIAAIQHHLPVQKVYTSDLASQFPEWSAEKIDAKTGIQCRSIAAPGECSSDLAVQACRKLFESGSCKPADVDYLLLCTQSPDYFLPTTACLLQDRLGLPTSAGALDFNLGCSGYIYGLGLAEGLISSGQGSTVLLVTAETYSKFMNPRDKSVRTIFGDAAAATLIRARASDAPLFGPFVYGTDGSGGENLIVPAGGMRKPSARETPEPVKDKSGNIRTAEDLYMNGGEIFTFTIDVVPKCVERLLAKAGLAVPDIDLFVFHQANKYMLEHLRKRIKIPPEKFLIAMADSGNTVSSTIPIALECAQSRGMLREGAKLMLVGFGVGYSWGATIVRWSTAAA
jgi:3-oxoacyl-[acyl-carrier-protein] synthase-3